MEIIYAKHLKGFLVAKCSREDARRFKGNAGYWRATSQDVPSLVQMVESDLGHAGFKIREVPISEFD